MLTKRRDPYWEGFLPQHSLFIGTHCGEAEPQENAAPKLSESTKIDLMEHLSSQIKGCNDCRLCETRTQVVVGVGNPSAPLVFVGEGPGEQEDLKGIPFVGPAGQLLDRMMGAIGQNRESTYVCNIVKCRPPKNRNPEEDEIAKCRKHLERQLSIVSPELVVALGKVAAQALLGRDVRITKERGEIYDASIGEKKFKVLLTYHPSYLLRNPSAKKEAWVDMQRIAKIMGFEIIRVKR